jgi:hypothetical protein
MDGELFKMIQEGKLILFSQNDDYLLDDAAYKRAAELFNAKQYSMFCGFMRPHIKLLRDYLGVDSYKVEGEVIPVDYAFQLDPQSAWINGRVMLETDSHKRSKASFVKIKCIRLYPRILFLSNRVIDAVVAHELAHASRFLSGREKQDIYNNDWVIDKKKGDWEEFWADREMKKCLPLVNPKYKSRKERLATLKAYHKHADRRNVIGFKAVPGQLWDRLMPFSDIRYR